MGLVKKKWRIPGGNNTTDKVFLLSIDEVKKYFHSDEARKVKATAYAKAQGAYVNSDNGNSWWWLRSPGYITGRAAYVLTYGSIYYNGDYVDNSFGTVRPALWINL